VGLGEGRSGTSDGDERGTVRRPLQQKCSEQPLSIWLGGDEAVPEVGTRGGWKTAPIEKHQ